MTYKTLLLDQDTQGIARLTLNRADVHNAMSAEMIAELSDAAQTLGADPNVRVVILTGAGRSFSAGADLAWMQSQMRASRETRMSGARALAHMLRALNEMPKPLIGRINGTAMGGGMGLMAICDVAIAADTGRFGFTETRLGLIPATISPYVIARMGEGRARRVFMSSRIFEAAELAPLGLAAQVVPMDALDAAIETEITPYLTAAPKAVAASKRLARSLGPIIDEAVIERTVEALADTWEGAEAPEGVAAFFAKRPAPWA